MGDTSALPIDQVPIEPPPTRWAFPDPRDADGDVVGVGADLEPGTILAAYRAGMFPMHLDPGSPRRTLAWWSPDPRAVLPLDGLRVSRSLRRSCRRFDVRIDTDFAAVVDGCADRGRAGRWIVSEIRDAYLQLHGLGWAHSVESWEGDELVGGLYGVAIGGFFAGESMFHRATDASKVALVALVNLLRKSRANLLDVQWRTDHLASLGAVEISREEYLARLRRALEAPSDLFSAHR